MTRLRSGLGVVVLALVVGPANSVGAVELVDRASGAAGQKANAESVTPSVSADGRFVAFASKASNLVPEDTDATLDVFVRDVESDITTLVSRASGPAGPKGEAASFLPTISGNGRFVAFKSFATNLTSEGADDGVYVRDLQTQTTVLVSRATGMFGEPALGIHSRPAISRDGGLIAFSSTASNLSPDGSTVTERVYVRDVETGLTELISRENGSVGAPCTGMSPSISGDGATISFSSTASCGLRRADNPFSAVFVRESLTTTKLASRAPGKRNKPFGTDVVGSSMSGNGRYVAFSPGAIFVRDLRKKSTKLAADLASTQDRPRTSGEESLDDSGKMVAFSSFRPTSDGRQRSRLYVSLWHTGEVRAVRRAAGATGGRETIAPDLTGDGSAVVFQSEAPGLVEDDPDGTRNIFLAETPG
jgi:Tol biopolymer transport system component